MRPRATSDISLSPKQDEVLRYLDGCKRASRRAIRGATGAGENTLVALRARNLIAESSGRIVLTAAGREAARI